MRQLKTQKGSVLIISLLLLVVTTLLGLSSMNNTIMEERMAGNLRQQNLSLQSAESSLREAEIWLSGLNKNTRPEAGVNPGSGTDPYIWLKDAPEGDGSGIPTDPSGLWWTNESLWSKYAEDYSNNTALGGTAGQYLIEELEPVADSITMGQQQDAQSVRDFFQVTTHGVGTDGRAQTYLRTTYARRF